MRDALDKEGGCLVLTNGCFDFLHAGHNFYLEKAAQLGDKLLVMLNSDDSVRSLKGSTRPVQDHWERAYNLAALFCVDYVCVFNTMRLDNEILKIRPHVYVKAGDYSMESLIPEEKAALIKVGAEIKFLPFLEGFSSTRLINKIVEAYKAGSL